MIFNSPSAPNSNTSGSYLTGSSQGLVSVIEVMSHQEITMVATDTHTYHVVDVSFLKVLSA